jgi:hypothetical protein
MGTAQKVGQIRDQYAAFAQLPADVRSGIFNTAYMILLQRNVATHAGRAMQDASAADAGPQQMEAPSAPATPQPVCGG